jgi:translation initiation factor eIF-2B subunit delta
MSNDQASASTSAPSSPATSTSQLKPKAKDAKSAKDLKREKRAAAVANRGGDAPPKRPAPLTTASAANVPSVPAAAPVSTAAPVLSQVQNLFAHLPSHKPVSTPSALLSSKLHPVIIRLGVLMSTGVLRGANARTLGLMAAFKEVVREYEAPEGTLLWKDLPVHLSPMIAWLDGCRPKGVGGGNAIR